MTRLLHAGISHVGFGGGYRLYVNGRLYHPLTAPQAGVPAPRFRPR